MLPRPWRRAFYTVIVFFSVYTFLAFLAISEHEGHLVQDVQVQQSAASKVLLWTNHSEDHVRKVAHNVSSSSPKTVVARVWPSVSNRSVVHPHPVRNITGPEVPASCAPASDCERLQQRLANWPAGKPKAVIYYLTHSQRLSLLRISLESVDNYFNNRFGYPIVIFHEAELKKQLSGIRQYTRSDVYFQQVEFSLPDFLSDPVQSDIPCMSSIGYRHMCRFNAKQVYEQPIMQGLDYYWRLDDDSRILRPVLQDPFVFMEQQGLVYGYQWIHVDNYDCVTGLWEATEQYIKDNSIIPHFFDQWPKPKIFYNNFEISRMDVWTSPEYKKYIKFLDHLGGMYYHRWGDAPIRGISLSLFVPMNKTHLFKEIGYEHTSFRNP